MIGTSEGHAYEDETDFQLRRPVNDQSIAPWDKPNQIEYNDWLSPEDQIDNIMDPEKPNINMLKATEKEMEDQLTYGNWNDDKRSNGPSPQKIGDKILQSPYERAQAAMDLNPQERSLYERHLSNLNSKGGVDNPDGSRSSLYATTVGFGDKTYVIPTVREGKILSSDDAIAAAKKDGVDNFPSYNSVDEAKKRYMQMHDFMEEDTKAYQRQRQRDPFNTKVEGKNQDRVPQNAPFPALPPNEQIATKI